jgi:hypothetical protein
LSIEEVLDHPLISNASALADDLPDAPTPAYRTGEVKVFRADHCPEGSSFADLAIAVKRRSSLKDSGFASKKGSTDAIPRMSPKVRTSNRASDSEIQHQGLSYVARRLAGDDLLDFT